MSSIRYNKGKILLWTVILFAILVRVLWLSDYLKTDAFPYAKDGDGQAFSLRAQDIAAGDFLRKDLNLTWPFYVYFLGGLLKLFSANFLFVILTQQFLGLANCVLVYLIGRKLFGETAGFVAGILCTAYVYFLFYECVLVYTSLSIFLVSLLFLLMQDLKDTSAKRKFFFAGFVFGVAYLTQANVLLFGFSAIIWILSIKKESFARAFRFFIVFSAGFLSIVSLQIARDSVAYGRFSLGPQCVGVNFFIGNNSRAGGVYTCLPEFTYTQKGINLDAKAIARGTLRRNLTDAEISGFWAAKAWDFIRHEPLAYGGLLCKKLKAIFSFDELVVEQEWNDAESGVPITRFLFRGLRWILPFSVLGMVLALREFRKVFLLYWAVAVFVFSMLLFFVISKHRLALVPFLLLFSGHGLAIFLAQVRERRYAALCFSLAVLTGVYFLFGYSLREVSANSPQELNLIQTHERLSLLRGYIAKERYQEAETGLSELERIQPENRFVLFDQGVVAFLTKDLGTAERKFKKAVEIFPYYAEALYNLGLIYNKEGRYQEADAILSRAAFLDPEDVGISFERAVSLKSLGRREEAKNEFREVLTRFNRWRTADIALVRNELRQLDKER